jgi:hypothetical protein
MYLMASLLPGSGNRIRASSFCGVFKESNYGKAERGWNARSGPVEVLAVVLPRCTGARNKPFPNYISSALH